MAHSANIIRCVMLIESDKPDDNRTHSQSNVNGCNDRTQKQWMHMKANCFSKLLEPSLRVRDQNTNNDQQDRKEHFEYGTTNVNVGPI